MDKLNWVIGLPLFLKLILSFIVVGLAVFVLVVLWSSNEGSSTKIEKKLHLLDDKKDDHKVDLPPEPLPSENKTADVEKKFFDLISKHIKLRDIFNEINSPEDMTKNDLVNRLNEIKNYFGGIVTNDYPLSVHEYINHLQSAVLGYCKDPINNSENFHATIMILGLIMRDLDIDEIKAEKFGNSQEIIKYIKDIKDLTYPIIDKFKGRKK